MNRNQGRKNSKLKWQLLSLAVDLLSVNAAFIVAFLIRFAGRLPSFNFNAYLDLAVYITFIFALIYYLHDFYDVERYFDWGGTAVRVLQANFIAVLLAVALSFALRIFSFPRSIFVLSYFLASTLVVLSRYLISRFFFLELPRERVFVVGSSSQIERIKSEIRAREHLGLVFAGSLEIERSPGEQEIASKIKKTISALEIDRIILCLTDHPKSLLLHLTEALPTDIRLQIVPDIYEALFGRLNFETLADIPLMDVGHPPDNAWNKFGKRVFDMVFSLFFLILLTPLFLLVALAIKLDSEGPVFYRQKRVGLMGKEFWCLKFRTMVKEAEMVSGPVLATENDPRITRVGRYLRRYRIDELPQLINILKGEMSLVGPRPERPEFVRKFEKNIPFYRYRHLVRPGATGLAQVYAYYATDAESKLKYDLIYIFNVSFFLDMLILFKTLNTVLTGKGAR